MDEFVTIVKQYYSLVDLKSYDEMFMLFSDDVVYVRGEQDISGMSDFKHFYLEERKLEGKHTIVEIISVSSQIIVKGVFDGTNGSGDAISIPFADFFNFSETGLIVKRETYFANGFKLIK